MHIRVGTHSGDVVGATNRALQIAADALAVAGGGTLEIGPGTYVMDDALRLSSRVHVVGSGAATVLRKCDGCSSALTIDADYGQRKLTVADAGRFRSGMGVVVGDDRHGGWHQTAARVTLVADRTLHIDEYLVSDYSADRAGFVRNACSIVSAIGADDVTIENLVVDGARGANEPVNGCRGGGIYLHKASGCRVVSCTVRDFAGDGISWQITTDVTVEGCTVTGSTGIGLHPGTGSSRTVIRGCTLRDNGSDGLFLCWRVQESTVEDCTITGNAGNGISVGHKDVGNLFRRNTIALNGRAGVHFRDEKRSNAGSSNRFESNLIEGNGAAVASPAVEILGATSDLTFVKNTIRPLEPARGSGGQRVAFLVGPQASDPELKDNEIGEHAEGTIRRLAPART